MAASEKADAAALSAASAPDRASVTASFRCALGAFAYVCVVLGHVGLCVRNDGGLVTRWWSVSMPVFCCFADTRRARVLCFWYLLAAPALGTVRY
eukprot:1113018-Rhodomonas_salina.1